MSNKINRMFSGIYQNYDTMNSILSLGFDRVWRKAASNEIMSDIDAKRINNILDMACGTGKLSIMITTDCIRSKIPVHVTGMDFNSHMLGVARRKLKSYPNFPTIFKKGDALNTGYPSRKFDIVTTGFALRDFDDLEKFSEETYRVLKNGGKLVILEMSMPRRGIMKYLFDIYFIIMKIEGALVDKGAYKFLVESIKSFDKGNMSNVLRKAGFINIRTKNLPSGAAFLMVAHKPILKSPKK